MHAFAATEGGGQPGGKVADNINLKNNCHVSAVIYDDNPEDQRVLHLTELGPVDPQSCEPEYSIQQAKALCASHPSIDLSLMTKNKEEDTFHRLFVLQDVCHASPITPQWKDVGPVELAPPIPFNLNEKMNPANNSFQAQFNYRGGAERLGEYVVEQLPVGLETAWQTEPVNVGIHTASKASPAVDETGIYVGGDDSWFYKFNHDGSKAWSFYVGGSRRGIHSTAALDKDRVYFAAYNGYVYALSKKDGHPLWIIRLGDSIGSSVLLEDETLYVSVEFGNKQGYVCKLRASDGKVIWRSEFLGEQGHSSVTLGNTTGTAKTKIAMAGDNSGKVSGFDAKTGQLLWAYRLGEDSHAEADEENSDEARINASVKGTGAVIAGHYVFTSWDKNIYSLDSHTGKLSWKTPIEGKSQSSPAVDSHLMIAVFSALDRIFAIHLKTGTVAWKQTLFPNPKHVPWDLQSGIILRDKKGKSQVLIQCQEKMICGMNTADGKTLWKLELPDYYTGAPTLWKNSVYMALENRSGLMRLNFRSGNASK